MVISFYVYSILHSYSCKYFNLYNSHVFTVVLNYRPILQVYPHQDNRMSGGTHTRCRLSSILKFWEHKSEWCIVPEQIVIWSYFLRLFVCAARMQSVKITDRYLTTLLNLEILLSFLFGTHFLQVVFLKRSWVKFIVTRAGRGVGVRNWYDH
jgi:hypothetical protein